MVKLKLKCNAYYVFDEIPQRTKSMKMQNKLPRMLLFSLNVLPFIQHFRVLGESEKVVRKGEKFGFYNFARDGELSLI